MISNNTKIKYLQTLIQIGVSLILLAIAQNSYGNAFAMPPTAVTAVKAVAVDWQPSIKETGTLIAPQGIMIASEIDGRITQIFFHSGQSVKQGDPLIQLNCDLIKAQLSEYQASLKQAQLAYTRSNNLAAKHFLSQADYEQAEANFHEAQAKVAQAQAMLSQTIINAPFAGRLGLRQVSVGDYVKAGQGLVSLQKTHPLYVNFNIPEKYLSKLHPGMKVSLKTTAYAKQEFAGQVFAFESVVDVNTRTLGARARIPNAEGHLLPGQFVEVELFLGETKSVVTIPQLALVVKDNPDAHSDDFVYIVKNGQAILTPVKVVARQNDNVFITKGIAADDMVITSGQIKLQDKAPVTIAK